MGKARLAGEVRVTFLKPTDLIEGECVMADEPPRRKASDFAPEVLGFFDQYTPRYDEAAARLAWQRTIDFFNHSMRAAP